MGSTDRGSAVTAVVAIKLIVYRYLRYFRSPKAARGRYFVHFIRYFSPVPAPRDFPVQSCNDRCYFVVEFCQAVQFSKATQLFYLEDGRAEPRRPCPFAT